MATTIKLNMERIKQLTDAAVISLEQTVEELHTDVLQADVIPRDLGTLENVKTFVDTRSSKRGKVRLVFNGPYARRLYFHPEYNFQTNENPNAKGKWLKDWIDGDKKDFVKDRFKQIYKRNANI